MSWVEPTFDCGQCDGQIARWPMKNLLRQDILDWRHRTIPAGVEPHRAVLGTPVPLADVVLAPVETEEKSSGPQPAPPPIVPARPAEPDELPASAGRLRKKALAAGWRIRAWYMHGPLMTARWEFSRMVESVVLQLERDGHRLVAAWRNDEPGSGAYRFDLAYSLTREATAISSPELTKLVERPRCICESCGEPPAMHHLTPTGPICHPVYLAQTATP